MKALHTSQTVLFSCILLIICSFRTEAQWSSNPTVNNAICTSQQNQMYPKNCSDGSGGAIITWMDARAVAPNYDIYTQHINGAGIVQWSANGNAICTAPQGQQEPEICSDGNGGAIITWRDKRSGINYDIYAQRISGAGTVQWTPDGVAICTATGKQWNPRVCCDGSGGAIITWEDPRGADSDIYAQRISAAGVTQWAANGIPVCIASGDQGGPQICRDGSGGAIITWVDQRGNDRDIYAQRINSAGIVQWAANGVPVCTETGTQNALQSCSDGSGGVIMTWQDERSGIDRDTYVQRISSAGVVQWTTNGIPVCTASGDQINPQICCDGNGEAIITWLDKRVGINVYAQRISSTGVIQWTTNGITICTSASGNYPIPGICSDGSSGAIITWTDKRGTYSDIYTQRISSTGAVQWTTNGIAVCSEWTPQAKPAICSDGSGGAIISWEDYRSQSNWDIYASKVLSSGLLLPVELSSFNGTLRAGKVVLTWETASELNNYGFEVERKVFSRQWERIGFVAGQGTNNSTGTYRYQDNLSSSLLSADHILYRLRQIDLDGSETVSPVVEVMLSGSRNPVPEFSIHPNPAKNTVWISMDEFGPDISSIRIYDRIGRLLLYREIANHATNGFRMLPLDVSALPAGMYILERINNRNVRIARLIVK